MFFFWSFFTQLSRYITCGWCSLHFKKRFSCPQLSNNMMIDNFENYEVSKINANRKFSRWVWSVRQTERSWYLKVIIFLWGQFRILIRTHVSNWPFGIWCGWRSMVCLRAHLKTQLSKKHFIHISQYFKNGKIVQ